MSNGVVFEGNSGPVTIINEDPCPRSTVIGKLIEIIASGCTESILLDRVPAEIEFKIQFNNLDGYQWLIDEYIGFSLLIDDSIRALNQTVLNGSTKLKQQMRRFYFQSLAKFKVSTNPFDLEKLKLNSDNIVKEVIFLVTQFVKASSDLKNGYFGEDIDHGIALITS